MNDLISRSDAIDVVMAEGRKVYTSECANAEWVIYEADAVEALSMLPSAEAVQGWRTGKPTESGKYMVTLDAWGHGHIDIFYYGKPLMPNRKIKGMCWYRSDDEWGDVVYDDEDIIAWMPLPDPYREDGE